MPTAVILTEGFLDGSTAKTSHGLLRYSEKYEILAVIDSQFSGSYTDDIIPESEHVPVVEDISALQEDIDTLIIGVATVGGYLPDSFVPHIKDALKRGIDVVSGLHNYLNEDDEFSRLAEEHGAEIHDIRRSPPLDELHYFQNRKEEIDALTIPFLGTDSSVGKRTALLSVYEELERRGRDVCWVATGQTGMLQGSDFGLPLDSITGDYMVGELEEQIWRAWKEENPELILIEGQGSISHPAYVCGSRAILAASQPDGVVLQHAPDREYRHYREDKIQWPMPDVEHECDLIELYSGAEVVSITLNPEDLSEEELEDHKKRYEKRFDVPVTNALKSPGPAADALEELLEKR